MPKMRGTPLIKRILLVAWVTFLLVFPAGTSVMFGEEQKTITAHDLLKAFTDDPGAAEAQYLNKTVRIEGIVASTGISKYMTPNVELSDRADGTVQAVCVMPRLDADKLSGFTPGQSVTMSGKVYKFYSGRMVIKECKTAE